MAKQSVSGHWGRGGGDSEGNEGISAATASDARLEVAKG